MKLIFRLFWLIATQSWRPRCALEDTCHTPMRVWPNDLDIFMHVNNGVYLTLMDLARTDFLLRADAFHSINRQGWYPVVTAETIRFRRSLSLGQKYRIETTVVGWNEQSFFLEQIFVRGKVRIAHAAVETRFLKRKGGAVTPQELLDLLAYDGDKKVTPTWIQQWRDSLTATQVSEVNA